MTRLNALRTTLASLARTFATIPALTLAQAAPGSTPAPAGGEAGGGGWLWIIAAIVVLAIIWWAMSSRRRGATRGRL
jgi:Na+/melibiose symporter-like transporter